MKYHKLSYRF